MHFYIKWSTNQRLADAWGTASFLRFTQGSFLKFESHLAKKTRVFFTYFAYQSLQDFIIWFDSTKVGEKSRIKNLAYQRPCLSKTGLFLNIFEKIKVRNNSRKFQPKTQRNGSNSSNRNFRNNTFVNFCAVYWPIFSKLHQKTTSYLLKSQIFAKRRPFDKQKICCTLKNFRKKIKLFGEYSRILASKLNDMVVAHYNWLPKKY